MKRYLPLLVLLALMAFEFQAVRARCEGHFVYTLDDAYIHLALAERINGGHYGINVGEASAPASSILWPFLLAPFARAAFFEYVPLALNTLFAAAALGVYGGILRAILGERSPQGQVRAAVISLLLIPTTNLVGLAFTGMEHSLQVLLCALIVYGLVLVTQTGQIRPWLPIVMILAPLVRFECLALVLPALGYLLVGPRPAAMAGAPAGPSADPLLAPASMPTAVAGLPSGFRTVALTLTGLALGLGGFSLFLRSQGLGWLPTSVTAKAAYLGPGSAGMSGASAGPVLGALDRLLHGLGQNLNQYQGIVLVLLLLALLGYALRARATPDRWLARAGALALALHLAFGQVGWWDRYEVYALTAAVLFLLYLTRAAWAAEPLSRSTRGFIGLLALLIGAPYIINFFLTPPGAENIYEQQYQMHRFVTGYYRAPVAVNDLGWVAYRNPHYVLDLWGLASPDALHYRLQGGSPDWMDRVARSRNVHLALIYDQWFPNRPPTWRPVARLVLSEAPAWMVLWLGTDSLTASDNTVTFYALDAETEREVREMLVEFEKTLPAGVRLEME